ncbi:MAG: type IV pilin [Methanoregula sp.]|uniref:type IV pilin n=1 Tax=Methanoregula sp. TaxID=2052170 RepID=UPI0025D144D7|nr:type IV pilin [Methanoregula sp.]MCK9630602.1 type IV pilin [Methanoregula sp.]
MHYLKNRTRKKGDEAVSPVVGVMLMLVVVIIIAAVVSGFAGGMIGTNNQKAPTLNMDVKIINMGSWAGSGFFATVTAVSKPIPTDELKIVTSWTATNRTSGESITGGSTVVPLITNVNVMGNPQTGYSGNTYVAPQGIGPGVNGSATIGYKDTNAMNFKPYYQQFGRYMLVPGTALSGIPCGQRDFNQVPGGRWSYSGSGNTPANPSSANGYGVSTLFSYKIHDSRPFYNDSTEAVLGPYWEKLRAGDKVNVKFIHIPTGKVIFQKDIAVTEG